MPHKMIMVDSCPGTEVCLTGASVYFFTSFLWLWAREERRHDGALDGQVRHRILWAEKYLCNNAHGATWPRCDAKKSCPFHGLHRDGECR